MAKKSTDELLSSLLQKQATIKNRIASIEARQRKDEDRVLTRKKILIGAYIIEKLKGSHEDEKKLAQEMDKFLIRQHDRKLFGLPTNLDNLA